MDAIQRSDVSQYKGMLDIPSELLLTILTYMDHHNLKAFALTSKFLCHLLLPKYLCEHGLTLQDTGTGDNYVELGSLSGCASLRLWSVLPMFHPPEGMSFVVPYVTKEAQSSIGFVTRFLLNPSNTSHLQRFHYFLGPKLLLIMPELVKFHESFCALPLTCLHISGFGMASCLSLSLPLRCGITCTSCTLESLVISSNHSFTPNLMQTTLGILKQSPIKSLRISMVFLKPSQWSTLFGQLNMSLLENIEVKGDIPQPALIRFLMKHRSLKVVHIEGVVSSSHTQPSRSQNQCFLPNLCNLHAPLAICCDIIGRASDPSNLCDLHVELTQLHPCDPSFRDLLVGLQNFPKLDNFGLRLVPSSQSAAASPGHWVIHPASELKQVCTLTFLSQGLLSSGDIVCPHLLSIVFLTYIVTGHDMYLHMIISNARSGPCDRRRGDSS
jgi:hypothetical protein